jgi:hypothetical protein
MQTLEVIYSDDRRHPAHDQAVLARVDALARYLNWNKYDPTGNGVHAKRCWAKAYDRFNRMQKDPAWWQLSCPRQFAIANPSGIIPNYKAPEPFGSPLPKHDIDVEKLRVELKRRLCSASLSKKDVTLIKNALQNYSEIGPNIELLLLWVGLYENHKALEKIARGNLKDHGWEYSGVEDFDPSDAELSKKHGLDEKTVSAIRRAMYILLRKRKGAPSKMNPRRSLLTLGIRADDSRSQSLAA